MVTVDQLGATKTFTDRNGSVHKLTYDVLGRMTTDAVTTLGAGVDGAVRRMEVAFDTQGNAFKFTSYDAATGGNVVNQVQREFNGLGQMTKEYQEHAGLVNTGTSLNVQYAFSEMTGGANHSRLTQMTYPNGKTLDFNYSSGLNSTISRLSSISDSTGTLESYDFLGLGTVVRRAHPQPGVDLTYIKQGAEPNSASTTAERYKEHRPFGFPVLHDDGNTIAQSYGVFTPAKNGKPEELLHGTFVIDQQGIVRWSTFGEQPFSDNRTLLGEIAKIREAAERR